MDSHNVDSEPKVFQIDNVNRIRRVAVPSSKGGSGHRFSWFDEEAGIDDMIHMPELKEDIILRNLAVRFDRGIIYTSIGSILIAVNPYKMLPNMYGMEAVKSYGSDFQLTSLPPHLFGIGSATLSWMRKEQEDQVVVISGESGAGKTESTKLLLQYLAAVNKASNNLVTEQILEASPLLESFGNAKTMRNDNSSRFGKYLTIYFNKEGSISGAKITEYLLEKSRICTHGEYERNYHVFYELLAGLEKEEKLKYGLQDDFRIYYYLNQGGPNTTAPKNDAAEFAVLKSAMQVLDFTTAERENVFKILASILHLGNVRFVPKQEDFQHEAVVVERDAEVRWIAHLLQISDSGITAALTTKTTEARNEKLLTALNRSQAFDARDAIAKALYSRLFTWLVERINQVVAQDAHRITSISLLDIFGFEDFKENSFEQLCINYANETLQFYFNQHIFKLEQQEYNKEKIRWDNIDFVDNQAVLDLIAKRPTGLFCLLDDESNFPRATDQSFLEKCHNNHGPNTLYQRPRTLHPSFAIRHYAGQVSYSVNGFLDKNRDTLRADVIELFIGSGLTMVSRMFQEWKDSADFVKTVKRGVGRFVTMKPRTPTVSARFQESLTLLVENMSKCRPHFIRCIKPNNTKSPGVFEDRLVLDQLKYTGMLETIRIRKIGYPVRLKFHHFVDQYKCMLGKNRRILVGTTPKDGCRLILESVDKISGQKTNKDLPHWQLGSSKVFLCESFNQKLETEKKRVLENAAVTIQKAIRGHIQRKRFKEQRNAAIKIQSRFRGFRQRKKYQQVKSGIIRAQATLKMRRQRKLYLESKEAPKTQRQPSFNKKGAQASGFERQKSPEARRLPTELSDMLERINDWQQSDGERAAITQAEPVPTSVSHHLPPDIDDYSFMKYAGVFCKGRNWGPRKEPLEEPFFVILTGQDREEALDIFNMILAFLFDLTLSERQEKLLADYIAIKGISNERLRDEIYCQLLNQTWSPELLTNIRASNGSSVSPVEVLDETCIERAWILVLHCLSAFPPSNGLIKPFLKHISDYALESCRYFCQAKLLQFMHLSGTPVSRMLPPSNLEYRANRKLAQMVLGASLNDTQTSNALVSSWTTAEAFAKDILAQRGLSDACDGWTVTLVPEGSDDLLDLNGTDYLLDAIVEMELPPFFSRDESDLFHRKVRNSLPGSSDDDSDYVGQVDFGDEDEETMSLAAKGGLLSKDSKLNRRYVADRRDLAKESVLNSRYQRVDASVAIGMGPLPEDSRGFSELAQSKLNSRYYKDVTSNSVPNLSEVKTPAVPLAPSKLNDRYAQESKPGNHAKPFSNGPRLERVRIPTSTTNRDIDTYLDEIFDPVLQNGDAFSDEEESYHIDTKVLANSIKGGRGKGKQPVDPSHQGMGPGQQPYLYPAQMQAAAYGPQYGLQAPVGAHGMPPVGYYPSIDPTGLHGLGYGRGREPMMRHAISTEYLAEMEAHARMHVPKSRPSSMYMGSTSNLAFPDYAQFPFGHANAYHSDLLGFGQVLYPAQPAPVDPRVQQYLHQQNLAAQLQLQQQLADALHQNLELQRKLLENQALSNVNLHHPGGSDGMSSENASPDSLPGTPPGGADFIYQNNPHDFKRTVTPLPTKPAVALNNNPPLPPKKSEVPHSQAAARNVTAAAPPPPPPPPPPLPRRSDTPDGKENAKPFKEQINGRANTIRIGGVRWPPPREDPPPQEDSPQEPKRVANLEAILNPVPADSVPKKPASSPNRFKLDHATWSRLENIVGDQSLRPKEKPKQQQVIHRHPIMQPNTHNAPAPKSAKAVLDSRGIPVPPPLPKGAVPLKNTPANEKPENVPQSTTEAEVHSGPKLAPHPIGTKHAELHLPSKRTFLGYDKPSWKLIVRKEFFTPKETLEDPKMVELVFRQVVKDAHCNRCVRLAREDRSKMRTTMESHGISPTNTGELRKVPGVEVMKKVIDVAKELPLYFCRFYPVVRGKSSGWMLGAAHNGLRLVRVETSDDTNFRRLQLEASCSFLELLDAKTTNKHSLDVSFVKIDPKGQRTLSWSLSSKKATEIKTLIDDLAAEFDSVSNMGGGSNGFVRAVMDYRTKDPELLSFRRGDIIKLATRAQSFLDKGWMYGGINDRWGIFPSEYVQPLSRQEIIQLKLKEIERIQKGPRTEVIPRAKQDMGSTGADTPTSNSSVSTAPSSESDAAQNPKGHDGKHSMLEFAIFNFRQSIDKYGIRKPDRRSSIISSSSSLQGSIKQIEKLKDQSGKDWNWKEQAEMVKFTRSPITHSLLKFDDPTLNERAVRTFYCLMKFMGDYPLGKGERDIDCVYQILMMCHQNPTLRDEIYCQMIKQVTNNKSVKQESCSRGWRILSILAAYFDCSDNLRPYLLNYLEKAAYDKRRPHHGTALVCLQNLRKTLKYGGRKNVPSEDEVVAIAMGRSAKRQIYCLPGGTEKVLNTKSTTVVEDVIVEICGQLGIDVENEMDEYSLYAMRDREDLFGVPLKHEDYILDVTVEIQKTKQDFFLLFRRSVWYYPVRTSDPLNNQVYIDIMFHQIVPDYLDGLFLICPPGGLLDEEIKEISKIAALLHRSTGKDTEPDVKETKYLLPKPVLILRDPRPQQWVEIVSDFFQSSVRKLSPIAAKAEFLHMLQRWMLFGSSFYFVHRFTTVIHDNAPFNPQASLPRSMDGKRGQLPLMTENILAVNRNGVYFLDVESHEKILHYPFSEVISTRRIKNKEDGTWYLDMKCGNLLSQAIIRMQTMQAQEIARLIGHYIHVESAAAARKAVRAIGAAAERKRPTEAQVEPRPKA